MPIDITLDGRTVLVTGGANGMGRACAVRLARAGAEVTVVDPDEATAKEGSFIMGTSFMMDGGWSAH